MHAAEIARFWAKVKKGTNCWEWTASKRAKGYGAFVYVRDNRVVQGRAHRFSWELHYGPIPPGMCVLHRCDNPACVNPEHLWIGTRADNNADMIAKGRNVVGGTYGPGRYPRGEHHPNAQTSWPIVRRIRAEYGPTTSYARLAKKYHLSQTAVFRIVKGITWKEKV